MCVVNVKLQVVRKAVVRSSHGSREWRLPTAIQEAVTLQAQGRYTCGCAARRKAAMVAVVAIPVAAVATNQDQEAGMIQVVAEVVRVAADQGAGAVVDQAAAVARRPVADGR